MNRFLDRVAQTTGVAFLSFVLITAPITPALSQAALLPNAKQQFLDQNGNPASNGRVFMYVPNTTTPKTTWQDSSQSIPNTNPVQLDAGGYAIIYGQGSYQQRVVKSDNTQLWNAPTTAWNSAAPTGATGTDTAPVGAVMPWAGFVVPTNWAYANGATVLRASYPEFVGAITISYNSVSCTAGSALLGGWPTTAQIRIGAPVEASCVPTGVTVAKIVDSSTIQVSSNAVATGTVTATVFPWGNGNGVDTITIPDLRGYVLPGANAMGGVTASTVLQRSATGSVTLGSATVTLTSATGIAAGMAVISGYFPANTIVSSITGTTATMSNVSSTSDSAASLLFLPFTSANQPAAAGGSTYHTQTQQEMAAHIHGLSLTDPGHSHGERGDGSGGVSNRVVLGLGNSSDSSSTSVTTAATTGITGTISSTGNSAAFSIIQPSRTINYIIKIKPNTTGAGGVVSLGGMFGDIVCDSTFVCAAVGIPAVNTIGCATATTSQLGCVRPDGTTITVSGGVISSTLASLTNGGTPILSGTSGRVLFDNAGVLGEKDITGTGNVVLQTSPTFLGHPTIEGTTTTGATGTGNLVFGTSPSISGLTVTGSFTATGLVKNADLTNSSTTVNGQVCTLGSTCTVTASSTNMTVGSTTVTGGTSGRVLYDNAGVLGEMTTSGSGTQLALTNSPSFVTPDLGTATANSINKVSITAPATGATLTVADGKILTDTSGVGANILLGAVGGGFTSYGGASCTNQFIRGLSTAGAATCATVANTDLASSSITFGSTAVSLGGTLAAATARGANGFNNESIHTTGDADVAIGAATRTEQTTTTLTAARTWTLPAASALNPGQSLIVSDAAGAINGANTITVQRAGGDTINGAASFVMSTQYRQVTLISDGASKWTYNAASGGGGAGTVTSVTCDGLSITTSGTCPGDYGKVLTNGRIDVTVAGNALTVAIKTAAGTDPTAASPVCAYFRNTTATTGDYTQVCATAATSFSTGTSGSTFGSLNATGFRLWVNVYNNGGALAVGVFNASTATAVYPLTESSVVSTTACNSCTNATSAGAHYTTSALTSKAFRIVGYATWEDGQTTAGTWATAPSKVQLFGPGIKKPGEVVQSGFLQNLALDETTTSTLYVDVPGTSLILTPTSKVNKVRATYSFYSIIGAAGAGNNSEQFVQLVRGSTQIAEGRIGVVSGTGTNFQTDGNYAFIVMDVPASVSSTTYKLQQMAAVSAGTATARVRRLNAQIDEIMQ